MPNNTNPHDVSMACHFLQTTNSELIWLKKISKRKATQVVSPKRKKKQQHLPKEDNEISGSSHSDLGSDAVIELSDNGPHTESDDPDDKLSM